MSQYLDKDGASRIAENFLSKQAEQDAILKNLQFDLKEAEHALVKTIQGQAPLNIRALTRPLDNYIISGDTLQDGTPTPEAPVDVVGCGEWYSTKQQYKLPVTVNGTEYPIYLGQVPATRYIKKLVLDGTENWKLQSINSYGIANFETPFTYAVASASYHLRISSHFVSQNTIIADTKTEGFLMNMNHVLFLRLDSEEIDTPTKLKNWLATEYTNGTPVVVWYVLAEPETGIINEPLHKIGDYADTITMAQSGVEISTTKGFNTITTDTTVLPSNIEVKGVINNA